MASSSTSSNQKSFKYHVFLSFRGEDTRKTFVDHLYDALKRLGIHTFRDNEELEKGRRIDELFNAIEESRFLIIVFSKNYASSSWCLKELVKIMECQDENQQIAYPVFYDVEPTDIRKRSGPVGRAIAKHKSNKEQIQKWEKALESAGNLVGWDLKNIANGHEAEAIKIIVEKISLKLRSIHLSNNDENLIGIERRMQDLESSLGIGLNDKARTIGIRGMGGIGKTTLARAIFEKVSFRFEGSSFVADVREVSKKKGLQSLQERVLSNVLNDQHMRVANVFGGKEIMKTRLPYKKVLLVLDDVDDAKQLEALAGDWFKNGSRIIITTRDRKVLLDHGVNVKWIHDANLLSEEEAISLFSRYAFKRHIPEQGYEKLSSKVVHYAVGLPLTIKVLGSHLHGEKKVFWRDALRRLDSIPCRETLDVLEISYKGLAKDIQQIFLHVACFMMGSPKDDAIQTLDSCGFCATNGLTILEQKSLITILKDEVLGIHDSIKELAKDIVRRSHPDDPSKHSLLWNPEEIKELFSDDAGTEGSPCIGLKVGLQLGHELGPENIMKGLGNMNKLRYLSVYPSMDYYFSPDMQQKFDQPKWYFPNSLQSLFWYEYPFRSLPKKFLANNLVELKLPYNKMKQLWKSRERKVLKKLRFLDLSGSELLRTLDLGMTPNLERLNLKGCVHLTELESVSGSVCGLQHLRQLALSGRIKESVSRSVCGLQHLRQLALSGRIKELPKDLGQLKRLEELSLSNIHISCLPDSVCMLKNLKSLKLKSCQYLEKLPEDLGRLIHLEELSLSALEITRLPDSMCMLKRLRFLKVKYCGLHEMPEDLGQLKCLEELSLSEIHIRYLPVSVCMLKHLKSLKLEDCKKLEELPENLGWLEHLEELSLSSTDIRRLPDTICMLKHLKSLELKGRLVLKKLPEDLGQLVCLEKLNLLSVGIRRLPDTICMLKHLKSLELEHCIFLKKLPEDIGRLECLEKLNLRECASLGEIPNSICKMKCLRYLNLSRSQVKKLPEELGSLKLLKELDIEFTGISHLPQSISC